MDELEKTRHFIARNRALLPSEYQRVYMYIADWNRVVGLGCGYDREGGAWLDARTEIGVGVRKASDVETASLDVRRLGLSQPMAPDRSGSESTPSRGMPKKRWSNTHDASASAEVVANGLNEGGIGIGILNAYAPGAGVQELTAVCQLAAAHDVPTFTHVAYMSRIDPESAAEAYIRLIGFAGATGAHMHICHFNSSSKTDVERCAALVAKAQAQGSETQ